MFVEDHGHLHSSVNTLEYEESDLLQILDLSVSVSCAVAVGACEKVKVVLFELCSEVAHGVFVDLAIVYLV